MATSPAAGSNLEMVLELMKGEAIEVDFPSRSGQSYVGSLVNGGLKTEHLMTERPQS